MSGPVPVEPAEPFDLATARLNRGFSARGLARELGIHDNAIRRLEAGEVVHPATAKKVADFFKVKVTDIMRRSAAA